MVLFTKRNLHVKLQLESFELELIKRTIPISYEIIQHKLDLHTRYRSKGSTENFGRFQRKKRK